MATIRQSVESRISSAAIPFKEVAGAVDLKAIMTGRVAYPACYVYRERNAVTDSESLNFVSQQRTEYIALIITTRNVQDTRGVINADQCEDFCNQVEDVILGWTPNQYYSPLTYSEGGLLMLSDGYHYWREVYKTTATIRGIT